MPIGIELAFSRDLICKYTTDKEIEDEVRRHSRFWQVIGPFDFLQISPLMALDDIGKGLDRQRPVAIGAHTGMVLIPFRDSAHDRAFQEFLQIICDTGSLGSPQEKSDQDHELGEYPILFGAKISLSAVAYEQHETFTSTLEAVHAAHRIVMRILDDPVVHQGCRPERVHLFMTLSSSDIVLLALPNTFEELMSVDRVAQAVRTLTLEQLTEEMAADKNPPRSAAPDVSTQIGSRFQVSTTADRKSPTLIKVSGHALSAVDEFVALRLMDPCRLEDKTRSGCFRMDFQLQLDCGHDLWVKEKLRRLFPQMKVNSHGLGRHTVRCSLNSLSEFATLWNEMWGNYQYRAANLVDSMTCIVLSDPEEKIDLGNTTELQVLQTGALPINDHDDHPAWELTDFAWNLELKAIVSRLSGWACDFLSQEQQREFFNIIGTFRSCFLHHELASAARDLVPFFRQLSLACKSENHHHWSSYLTSSDPEFFASEISRLLLHLNRAVRNRLEHRSGHADPTIPHTLVHGASKLVGAYSGIYWFCSEFFGHDSSQSANPSMQADRKEYCYADNLSVCVAAGNEGRISCEEVFLDFRLWVERATGKPLSSSGEDEWTGRLLLLDVSGNSLFRPAFCLVHCLHEVAEFSDWLQSERTSLLRVRVNAWVLQEMLHFLGNLALESLSESENNDQMVRGTNAWKELQAYQSHFVAHAVDVMVKRHNDGDALPCLAGHTNITSFDSACERLHPFDFQALVGTAIYTLGARPETWHGALPRAKAANHNVKRVPLFARAVIDVLTPGYSRPRSSKRRKPFYTFSDGWRSIREVSTEIVADIGMWCSLDHILSNGLPHTRPLDVRLLDVHMVYESLFIASRDRGERFLTRQVCEFLLLRWSVQVATLDGTADWPNQLIDYIERRPSLQQVLDSCLKPTGVPEAADGNSEPSAASIVRAFVTLQPTVFSQNGASLVHLLRRGINDTDGSTSYLSYYHVSDSVIEKRDPISDIGFPHFHNDGTAESIVWREFVGVWNTLRKAYHSDTREAEQSDRKTTWRQIKFVYMMWAKSVRLRYPRLFKMCDSLEEEINNQSDLGDETPDA